MFAFLLRRALLLIPVVLTVAVVTFALMHRAPGGPWDADKPIPTASRAMLDARFGLDKPLWVNRPGLSASWAAGERNPLALARVGLDAQFFGYLAGLARLDFGPSYQSRGTVEVRDVLADRFPTSFRVGVVAVVFAAGVGLPLGVAAALRQNGWADYACLAAATVGSAIPAFVSGILLVIFASAVLGVAPVRRPEEWDGFGPAYLLPGIVLGFGTLAYVARLTRASVLEVKRQEFVLTARAKGLTESAVVVGHLLRNALLPVVTVLGPAAADLITGSFVVETIFNVPGMGREFVSSISRRDYPMIMGTTLFYAVLVALANVAVDVGYAVLDPRIAADGG